MMRGYQFLSKKEGCNDPERIGFVIAESFEDAESKLSNVVGVINNSFSFSLIKESEQNIIELKQRGLILFDDPAVVDMLSIAIYGRLDGKHLSPYLFGLYPEDYDKVSKEVPPPDGYLEEMTKLFNAGEYYELNAKVKEYGKLTW